MDYSDHHRGSPVSSVALAHSPSEVYRGAPAIVLWRVYYAVLSLEAVFLVSYYVLGFLTLRKNKMKWFHSMAHFML